VYDKRNPLDGPIMPGAKERRLRFIAEYCSNGYNGLKAYQKVNPSANYQTAMRNAKNILKEPWVARELQKKRKYLMRKMDISEERVLQEIACLAFLDIADLLNEDGSLRKISEIPEEARRAMAGLELSELYEGSGDGRANVGVLKKLKLESKSKALEMLGRYHAIFTDKTEVDVGNNLASAILEARKRVKELSGEAPKELELGEMPELDVDDEEGDLVYVEAEPTEPAGPDEPFVDPFE